MVINKKYFSKYNLSLLLHILAWIIILLIPIYLNTTIGNKEKFFPYHLYINFILYGIIFYMNYFWLVPGFFLNGKKSTYFAIAISITIILSGLTWYIGKQILFDLDMSREIMDKFNEDFGKHGFKRPPMPPSTFFEFRFYNFVITSLLILGFSLGLKLIEKVNHDEKELKELEKAKLNTELSFLKNQISPHFFFNTLNNIYSLIGINVDDAQQSVLKLSKLMRYLLYETEKGKTKLSEEIKFLEYFIDLMRLRLNEKVILNISLPSDYNDIDISSLLFIPFIENAFKHGVSYREPSFINIKLEVSDNQLKFQTINSIIKNKHYEPIKYSGIGLENVKKRLRLLYPNSHSLKIVNTEKEFQVVLVIFLNLDNEINSDNSN